MLKRSCFPKRIVGVREGFELGLWALMMLTMMMMIEKSLKRPFYQVQAGRCLRSRDASCTYKLFLRCRKGHVLFVPHANLNLRIGRTIIRT